MLDVKGEVDVVSESFWAGKIIHIHIFLMLPEGPPLYRRLPLGGALCHACTRIFFDFSLICGLFLFLFHALEGLEHAHADDADEQAFIIGIKRQHTQ